MLTFFSNKYNSLVGECDIIYVYWMKTDLRLCVFFICEDIGLFRVFDGFLKMLLKVQVFTISILLWS